MHILDPFTGTGTFITRLMQSGLIPLEDLPRKYASEIHANELVLLAYYIAAINIEATYHGLVGGDYKPFEGICLTDTFQDHGEDLAGGWLAAHNKRRKRQDQLDIRVIIGNSPTDRCISEEEIQTIIPAAQHPPPPPPSRHGGSVGWGPPDGLFYSPFPHVLVIFMMAFVPQSTGSPVLCLSDVDLTAHYPLGPSHEIDLKN